MNALAGQVAQGFVLIGGAYRASIIEKLGERILHLLCEGQSIRAITRVLGVSKNTDGPTTRCSGVSAWLAPVY